MIDYTDPDIIARQNIAPNAGCNIDGKFYDVRNLVHLASSQADRIEAMTAKLAKAVEALTPLAAIADAFDANELDDEARKFWGQHSVNTTPHEDIELYQGRGGKQLLTLADCTFARAILAEIKGESHE